MSARKKITEASVVCLAAALLIASPVGAQEEPFYEGKTINVYVGRTPGSGADLAARVFSEFWARHIPGEPTIVVRNLPGGGGTRVWNYGSEVAESDGLHIMFSPTNGIAAVMKEPG